MSKDSLENRIAFITGGAGGVGKCTGRAMLEKGAKVVLADITQEGLQKASDEIKALDPSYADKIGTVQVDLTSLESIDQALTAAEKFFGPVDILVNAAGTFTVRDLLDVPEHEFDLNFKVNTKGLFYCSVNFAKRLIARKAHGNIVNVCSNAAVVCFPRMGPYNASKAAAKNLTQCMAMEWSQYGINVNAVNPGAIDTGMLKNCFAQMTGHEDDEYKKFAGPAQLGRLVDPYEVAQIVAFFASDAAIILRGQAVNIDGGQTPC